MGTQTLEHSKMGRKKRKGQNKTLQGWFFLSPSFLLLLIFFIGPILMTFFFSFTNMSLTGANAKAFDFVGFQNFVDMFKDPNFKYSFWYSIVFLIFSAIIGQQVLGFLVAILMKEKNKNFRRIVGLTVMAGWVTPEVIVAFAFVAFFGDSGTLNHFIGWLGFKPVSWLYVFPMTSVVIANIWHGTAYSMMMFQSALDSVPESINEAAMIDGANRWQRLWRVTIPMIKSTIMTNLVIITLNTLGVFSLIYTMTAGGPSGMTNTLPLFMYQQAFINYQVGYGTAISLFILLIGIVFSLVYLRMLKSEK